MGELISKLGIDGKLLIAQIINFGILLFVLKKFLYKPILDILEQRRVKIEKGLKNAERLEGEMGRVKEAREEVLRKANKSAAKILEEARELADSKKSEIIALAQSESERLRVQTQVDLEREKEKVMAEAREELSELVFMATEKVARTKMDPQKDKELVKEALTFVNKG